MMASEGGGKIKSKRGHSSSKPYERRKSLLGRITESIKDVLLPSWLASDVTPTSSDRPGTSAADDDEEFVSPASSPSQLSEHGKFDLRTAGDGSQQRLQHPATSRTATDDPAVWQQSRQRSQGQAGKSTWGNNAAVFDKMQFSRHYFTQKHGDRTKATESTSQATSLGLGGEAPSETPLTTPSTSAHRSLFLPELDAASSSSGRQQQQQQGGPTVTGLEAGGAVSQSLPKTPADNQSKRQRLWSPNTSQRGKSPQMSAYAPAFKISVFSSPSLKDSMHESSFYSGKTAYGGASAYRRSSLNSSLPYQNSLPIRKSVKAKPLNNSGNAVLSSSASQILKTLERLSDAKRARINESETESLLSFTPTSHRKPSRPLQTSFPSRSLELPVHGPPRSLRQSPAAASIAKNRQIVSLPVKRPPPSATITRSSQEASVIDDDDDVQVIEAPKQQSQQSTSAASGHAAVTESAGFTMPPAAKPSGKMKHQKSYDTRHGKPNVEEDEVTEMPNLRTDFTLPIGSMPGFNFGLTSSTPTKPPQSSAVSAASSLVADSARTSLSQAAPVGSSAASDQDMPKLQFTFSTPIHKSGPDGSGSSPAPASDYQFSSPLKVSYSVSANNGQSPVTTGMVSTFTASSKDNSTPVAWGSTAPKPKSAATGNGMTNPTGGFTFGSDNKTASSTSTFGTAASSQASSSSAQEGSFKPAAQLKSGSVMDILGKSSQATSPPSSLKPAAELKQGSVMDILGGGGSKATEPSSLKPAAELRQGSVMDILGGKVPSSSPKPTTTSSDSLFAKFAVPAGSWECDSCMLQNKPDTTKCAACETPKRGAAAGSVPPASDSLMAKFRKPAGSWECDVCLVQNTASHSRCLACESPRPGSQSTGTAPPPAPAGLPSSATVGPKGGLVFNLPSSSSAAPSPFLAAVSSSSTTTTASSHPSTGFQFGAPSSSASGGFKFGVSSSGEKDSSSSSGFKFGNSQSTDTSASGFKLGSSSSQPSDTSAGGFTFGSSSSQSTDISASGFKLGSSTVPSVATDSSAGGFKFGAQDTSNSNSASSTSATKGFQLGATNSDCAVTAASGHPVSISAGLAATPSTTTSPGFQFGAPALNTSSGAGGLTPAAGPTTTVQGFGLGNTSSTGGFQLGSFTQSQPKDSDSKTAEDKTTSSSVSKEKTDTPKFNPVFGTGKPGNNFSLGAAPSLAAGGVSSLTSGGFQFPASPANKDVSSGFGSGLGSTVTSDAAKPDSGKPGVAVPSVPSGFSFGAVSKPDSDALPKPGLFAADSTSENGPTKSAQSTTSSQGFTFGVPEAATTTAATNLFNSVPQLSSGGFGANPGPNPATKLPVNGEVGSGLFSFSQQPATGSSATGGFVFGASGVNTKDTAGATNSLTQSKPFSFGAEATASHSTSEKCHLDNDIGPGDAKKRSFNFTATAGGDEPFKFGSTAPATGAGVFGFGQTSDGPAEKAPSVTPFGSQASGFGSGTTGGFSFTSGQSNAASSTGAPQAAPVFGAGAGSTNSGGFSFSMGAGSQSNAAAASPFGSEAPAPVQPQGFNFSGATKPSFNFGANSNNPAGPVFQFGSSQSTDSAPAQPVFMFGQAAPSAGSSAPPPSFGAPPAMGFGAAPAHSNFNIGSTEGPRRMKKAVRRGTRK